MPLAPHHILADPDRLAALRATKLLDSPAERGFDRLTSLAARVVHAPVALVSLVEDGRQFFKSCVGLDDPLASDRETPLTHSFCQHVVASGAPLVIEDARLHPLVRDNLAIPDLNVVAYLGIPLVLPGGQALGSFCVIDHVPRRWTDAEISIVADLAASVLAEIEVRLELERRERAEAALRASEERFRRVAVLTDTVVWEWDVIADVVTFSGAVARITGEADLVGPLGTSWWYAHVHPDDLARVEAGVRAALAGSASEWTDEYRMRRADGTYTVVCGRSQIVRDPTGRARRVYGSMIDVTERRTTEQALIAAKEAAERANRAKSEFLSRMSHELRTPLNSIIGFANILTQNRGGSLRPADITFARRIHANGIHLLEVINDILDLSRIEAGALMLRPAEIDLAQFVPEVIAQLEDRAEERGIAVVCAVPTPLETLVADPMRLRQVLINLIGNAVKFTERGSVAVRVVAPDGVPRRIDVIDTGIGIAADRIEAIFDPFEQAESTTARRYGGSGLGLAISRQLCRAMGFQLGVVSEPGVGSTFSVELG